MKSRKSKKPGKHLQNSGNQLRQRRPTRPVRDLLADFGHRRHRYNAVWVTLEPTKLPGYLRGLRIVQEAQRWVMVVSSEGSVVRYFKRQMLRS